MSNENLNPNQEDSNINTSNANDTDNTNNTNNTESNEFVYDTIKNKQ